MSAFPDMSIASVVAGIGGWAGVYYGASMYLDGGPLTARKAFEIASMPIIWSGGSIIALYLGTASLRATQFMYGSMFSGAPFIFNIIALASILSFGTLKTLFVDMPRFQAQNMPAAVAQPAPTVEAEAEAEAAEVEEAPAEEEEAEDAETEEDEADETEDDAQDDAQDDEAEASEPEATEATQTSTAAIDLTPILPASPLQAPIEPEELAIPPVIAPTLEDAVDQAMNEEID